ncbi:hypothetical protein F0Q45_22270 [Mycobacterium simiae]|uniref:PE family protein n=1 Tax=Mycobacterium simiae TaxID=1784 RepID=A0A5B1BIT3_MYCSI|nr:hypothetical protein [Mycobacterium simiae]KAA1247775.1 hypothetical protein F0Q45_22270 [Mycobacterium simiae]
MGPGQLRIDVSQLRATGSQWRELCTELNVLGPPSQGQPFQPTTAAVGSVHAAVGLAAAKSSARAQVTISAVEAGAAGYVGNEATAAAEMAAVPQTRVV